MAKMIRIFHLRTPFLATSTASQLPASASAGDGDGDSLRQRQCTVSAHKHKIKPTSKQTHGQDDDLAAAAVCRSQLTTLASAPTGSSSSIRTNLIIILLE